MVGVGQIPGSEVANTEELVGLAAYTYTTAGELKVEEIASLVGDGGVRQRAASQATPPHEQPAAAAAAAAPAAAPRRPDGDARNGVEESYAGGETNQGLTNDGDWSRRSSDTQRARARDKLPHTPGLRWIVARPSVRYQLPSAHATATANAEPRQ
ncbi:unnamed protein product [Heterotrigona itama]|uniref:Uncharacterized protein n=1 Tax=Heterotrigona itama TaxID=395501 RepID=A0A6V7HF52_9HYME|nr:unnamed protein product [Heterotrigona itama]